MTDFTLDAIELGAQTVVADHVRATLKHEVTHDPRLMATIVNTFTRLAGQRFQEMEFSYPADWWQAAKARWFPRWAQRRWPVRMTHHRWSPSVVYPMLAMPDEPRWEVMTATQFTGEGDP